MNREKNTESRCSEPLEEDKEHLSAMEHIVFGSKVTISLAEQPNFILHSQGFIQEDVLIHNINCNANDSLSLLGHDPSNCIFDILPFNSLRNFRFQSKMQKGVRNLETLQKKIFSEDSIKKRSENLEDFKKKLWEEVGSNKNFLEKMRGTNVLYENSIFVLLHSNSLKFLTLNIEENEKSQ